ncbi:MAG: metallophosphoesterase [Promethearchaeota archaeon]|nr:MAG: metallophosphoesterase [Candidatus Lokiarchaeota archaeon]
MYELDNDTIVVGVSDVHVGASINHHNVFIEFLNQVLLDSKNLQVVIILGDFFDIVMESVRDYCKKLYYPEGHRYIDQKTENYEKIFLRLRKLKEKGISIFFTLGNHEIKIIGNLEKWFSKRKKKLVEKFKKFNFRYADLFNLKNIWQYFILTADEGRWKLGFYDSKKEIVNQKNIYLFQFDKVEAPDISYNCLMTHGIQFETFLRKYGGGIPWYLGLKSPDAIKEVGNLLWNEVIKLSIRTIDKVFDRWLAQSRKITQRLLKISLISPFLIFLKLFDKLLKMVARKREKLKNETYIKQFRKKFLPKLVKMGYNREINKIIFGHTHKDTKLSVPLNNQRTKQSWKATIANSGAWQQIDKPSLIEINDKGEIKVVHVIAKEDEYEFRKILL